MLPNTIQMLTVHGTLLGQDYLHTLHFKQLATAFATEQAASQALIDAWQSAAQVAWLAAHANNYSLTAVGARRVCGSTPLPAELVETVNSAGTRSPGAQAAAAPWFSCLTSEYSLVAGRNYRGRYFLAGLFKDDISGDQVQSGYLTLANAYATALGPFLSGGANASWKLFVFSRKLASQPGMQCQNAGAEVASLVVRSQLTTQRSRRG